MHERYSGSFGLSTSPCTMGRTHNTLTQPTSFSFSTQSLDPVLWDESSYLICTTLAHHHLYCICLVTQDRILLPKVMGLRYEATLNRSRRRWSPSPYLIPKKRSSLPPGPAVSSHHSSTLIAPDSASIDHRNTTDFQPFLPVPSTTWLS